MGQLANYRAMLEVAEILRLQHKWEQLSRLLVHTAEEMHGHPEQRRVLIWASEAERRHLAGRRCAFIAQCPLFGGKGVCCGALQDVVPQ